MTPDVFDDDSDMEQEKVVGLKESSAKVDTQKLPKLQRVGRLAWQKPKTGFILLLFANGSDKGDKLHPGVLQVIYRHCSNLYLLSYQQAVL